MLSNIVPFTTRIRSSYVDSAFTFNESNYLRYRMFRWYRNHYMNMIGHYMPFLYVAFSLPGQAMKYISKLFSYLTK